MESTRPPNPTLLLRACPYGSRCLCCRMCVSASLTCGVSGTGSRGWQRCRHRLVSWEALPVQGARTGTPSLSIFVQLIDYSFSLGLRLVCFSPCTCWKAETTLWRPVSSGRRAKQIQQWGFAASLASSFLTSQPWQCRASAPACSSCCLILLPVA